MSKSHLINANIHRAKEGARVLEDIARFILRDDKLFRQVRDLRHQLQVSKPIYDISQDLGGFSLIEDNVRVDMVSIVQANALRIQEALRVLEEISDSALDKHQMKILRYHAYDLHSKLYYSASRHSRSRLLSGLYLIIDPNVISYPIEEIVDIINQSPVTIVQYRNKLASKKTAYNEAYTIRKQLDSDKLFVINDHTDIALDLAQGIHLGQDDYPLKRIRNIIPADYILGISCHNILEARTAMSFDVSYIAIGCLFKTNSKSDTIPVTISELQAVCHESSIPICGIGGINTNNLDQVLTANIKMAALISYVWHTENPLQTINEMHEKITLAKGIQSFQCVGLSMTTDICSS